LAKLRGMEWEVRGVFEVLRVSLQRRRDKASTVASVVVALYKRSINDPKRRPAVQQGAS
jgi:hypothetical protein